jgi:cytochrome P450
MICLTVGRYDLFKLHEANQAKYNTYGSILKEEYQWRKPIIHIFDPKDFEVVFRNQGKCPIRPPNEFVKHYRLKNSDKYPNVGLANLLGEDWYQQRLLLAPALMKLKVIQNHIPAQNKICDDFIDYLWDKRNKDSDVLANLQDATYRLALESICMMCLDSRMQCLSTSNTLSSDGSLLISATKRLFESYNELYYGIPVWKLFPTNSYRKLDEAESSIYNIASKYVQIAFSKIKQNRIANETQLRKRESVLQTLIKSDGLSEKDVKLTIIDFIAGGIFTVSNTLSFLFYHLAKNIDVQQKLFNEVNSVMGDSNEMTADMLTKMPYLKACVKECFRLSCPVPGIMRILPKPTILSGYHIPAGVRTI